MARPATGRVLVRERKQGRVFALRFSAYGKREYLTLGSTDEGWTRQKAELELANLLADVRRGAWKPARSEPVVAPAADPTFHEFASEWYARREREWREKTRIDYRWALSNHLLPFFRDHLLEEITIEEVDRYKAAKQREGKLSANSINKTLTRLAQILEDAVEYGRMDRNPAQGKRRRLKAEKPSRPWIEPEQLLVLLEAADQFTKPAFATLAGTGMRPGELAALDWRDVKLATGTITVCKSKTDAGVREVDLPVGLREELSEYKARSANTRADDPVFLMRSGLRQTTDNLSRRMKQAIPRANKRLQEQGIEPLAQEVTPYSFRRTFASLRASRWTDAIGNERPGDDPIYIADQMGHTDPKFTFRVYQRAVKRRERLAPAHLAAFDRALDWARKGTSGDFAPPPVIPSPPAQARVDA